MYCTIIIIISDFRGFKLFHFFYRTTIVISIIETLECPFFPRKRKKNQEKQRGCETES